MTDVLHRVMHIVAEGFGEPVDRLTPDTRFFEDLAASLDFEEVIMECEDVFGFSIPDEDAARFLTIGQLASYIEGRFEDRARDKENVWPPAPRRPGYGASADMW